MTGATLHHPGRAEPDPSLVNRFSWLFMIVSFLAMVAHVPFLDRAEKKRKDILTGGGAPPWLGPA